MNVYTRYYDENSDIDFYVDTTKHNEFILTELDTTKFIVGAKFSFIGVDKEGNMVEITEGEFRRKYIF